MQPSRGNKLWGAVAREKVASKMEPEHQTWYLTINNPFQGRFVRPGKVAGQSIFGAGEEIQ